MTPAQIERVDFLLRQIESAIASVRSGLAGGWTPHSGLRECERYAKLLYADEAWGEHASGGKR